MPMFIPTMVILQDLRNLDAQYRQFIKQQREMILATTYSRELRQTTGSTQEMEGKLVTIRGAIIQAAWV